MNRREIEAAIEKEVAEWPGAAVTIAEGAKHPKAKLVFGGLNLAVTFPGTTTDHNAIRIILGDVRRTLKKLGAERPKPEPTAEEDVAPYRKPNDGAEKRPDPVKREPVKPKPNVADQLVAAGAVSAEQVERISRTIVEQDEGEEPASVVDREAAIAAVKALIESIVDGIYFGLPDVIYHAIPRLSGSGLQKLCVSPATFWRGSWLDPDRPELDEDQTKAQLIGKAYHCARLEPEQFEIRYIRQPSKDDYSKAGLLTSDTAVKAALKDIGLQQTSANETIPERCQRLEDAGYDGTIFPLEMARWEATRNGRIPIPAEVWDEIVVDMERIRGNGEIIDLLEGGEAEVSIFWTNEHGLKMKARLDKLTVDHWTDLKTFDNSRGVRLEEAIANFVRYNRVHVQAVTYREAVEAIRTGGLQIQGDATDAQRALIAAIQIKPDELACWYVFQEKNGVPNLLAREFEFFHVDEEHKAAWDAGASEENVARGHAAVRHRTPLHVRARMDIGRAREDFMLYTQVYEPGRPWFPIDGARRPFDALDFNTFWLEGR